MISSLCSSCIYISRTCGVIICVHRYTYASEITMCRNRPKSKCTFYFKWRYMCGVADNIVQAAKIHFVKTKEFINTVVYCLVLILLRVEHAHAVYTLLNNDICTMTGAYSAYRSFPYGTIVKFITGINLQYMP